MNTEELVQEISKKTNQSQTQVRDILNVLVDTISKTVAKGKKVMKAWQRKILTINRVAV